MPKIEQSTCEYQIQVPHEETQNDGSTKEEEKGVRCVGWSIKAHELNKECQNFGCMRTCNTFTVGVCWVPNLSLFHTLFHISFTHLNLQNCQISCAKGYLTWFLIIFLCFLFDLDFVHSAAESCHFPQLLQLSAAILWNSMLQVSTGKTSHMGRSGMTWTWFVSYWFK